MSASMDTTFQIEQTILAAMRCQSIDTDTVRAFYRFPSAVNRTIISAVADMVATNGLNPKNLTVVGKLFTASVEVARKRLEA